MHCGARGPRASGRRSSADIVVGAEVPMGLGTRRYRGGVTLVEIAFVIAIIGIMAAIGAILMRETIPSWRTRQAANHFNASLMLARDLALREGLQYRVRIES